jgi:class 3 adenylate cyclase/tetratricopeptide (TPR) repeat protein
MDRREERRLVACLFIDVVGSTELTVRFGPERLKAALGAAFSELRGLIEREGGTVEKYIGDEIYALFGAPVAHEDDPARALRAADAARRWAASHAGSEVAFDVRIGIETGEAVIDLAATESSRQQMSVGAVVNVASRLCHQAEPGQVLVGPVAHAATEDLASFRALGALTLKGLGATEVWALDAFKDEAPRRRLPFVGRQSELELLSFAQRRSRDRSVLALVLGPPGQGKTRLVEEFIGSLADVRVLAARCRPGGETSALAPLREILLGPHQDAALDAIVTAAVGDPLERARVRDALAHSAGLAASAALGSLGRDERDDELQNAWRRLVKGLAAERPVVLWIEDLHWAAPDVVRLLDRLSLSGEPFLMIATARPEFAETAGLRPSGDRFFIELEGLERSAAQTLAASAGNADEATIARADGNPLFIVELARAREPVGDLPLTLRGALGARLDELELDDRSLLAHAAVVGETFAAADAAILARRDTPTVARALARLVDRHYLAPVDGRYRFHHSLLRDVAYGRLLVADRMRLHARYARERESSEDPEVLAYHWWAALGGPDAEWVWRDDPERSAMQKIAFATHITAGRRSADLFALDRAVPLLERALSLAADDSERGEAKRELGDAYAHDLRSDEAWRAYADARTLFSATGAVPPEVYLGALKIRMRVGAFNQQPRRDEVDDLYREAEAAARASGDAGILARTLVYGAFHDMDPATVSGDRSKILEALRLSEQTDPKTRREILGWYAQDLLRVFDLDRAVAVLDEIETLPVETTELDRMEHLRGRALLAFRGGDLAKLEEVSNDLVAMSRRMGPHLRSHADLYASQAAVARADWLEVIRLALETDRVMRTSPATAFCSSAGTILAYGALAEARGGHAEETRALAQRIRATTSEEQGVRDLLAFALVLLGGPIDADLLAGPTGAVTALAARSHERALAIADELDTQARAGARFWAALAEAIREEVAHDRGGPEPKHEALRAIGYVGWSELLSARV